MVCISCILCDSGSSTNISLVHVFLSVLCFVAVWRAGEFVVWLRPGRFGKAKKKSLIAYNIPVLCITSDMRSVDAIYALPAAVQVALPIVMWKLHNISFDGACYPLGWPGSADCCAIVSRAPLRRMSTHYSFVGLAVLLIVSLRFLFGMTVAENLVLIISYVLPE